MCDISREVFEDGFDPDEFSKTGYYKLDGKKLYIEEDEDDLEDSDEYVKVTIDGDTLLLDEGSGDELTGFEDSGFELPLTFTRVD